MQYVIYSDKSITSYLPIDEFYSYIDKDVIERYMSENNLEDANECAVRFKADIKSSFNSYSQTDMKINSVAESFIDLSDKVDIKCIDDCRLEFAEYVLENYDDPFGTLDKISINLAKHNSLPIGRISCKHDIDDIRSALTSNRDSEFLSELVSNSDFEWDSFEQLSR